MERRARTRDEVLRQAARLFAARGFRGTSVGEIGAACGVSGPALYKHFTSKQDLLGRLLVDISAQLLDQGRALAAAEEPREAVQALVDFHADFALAEPDLIRVQGRDLDALADADSRQVRRLQRAYVELWVEALRRCLPDLADETARLRVRAVFGLLNATAHSAPDVDGARDELAQMAARALGLATTTGRTPWNRSSVST